MPRVRVQIDERGLQGKLRNLAEWKNETIGEITRRHTRGCCVTLAMFTQPFGKDQATKKQGEAAVEKDIRRLYRDFDRLKEMVSLWKKSDWQQALLKALQAKDMATVMKLIDASYLKARLVSAPSRETHEKYRNNRGRVRTGGHWEIVQKAAALRSYIKQRQMKVGFAKSVWFTAASKLDLTLKNPGAGFPAWVSRHQGPSRVTDRTKNTDHPYVTISSALPWMDKVLSPANIGRAIISAKLNMIKYIEMTWKGELRKKFGSAKAA